jgi:hypothetical protein
MMVCRASAVASVVTAGDWSSVARSETLFNTEGCRSKPRVGTSRFNWASRLSKSRVDVVMGVSASIMVSKPLYEVSTMKQFNKLIEFRQAIYDHGLTPAKDAQ